MAKASERAVHDPVELDVTAHQSRTADRKIGLAFEQVADGLPALIDSPLDFNQAEACID